MKARSWTTKRWKAHREKFLEKRCARCGSREGPFVVQHHWHPPSFGRILQEVAFRLGLPEASYAVKQEAAHRYKAAQIRYLSFRDAETYCRRCAFIEDKTDYVLCDICRKNYHKPEYDQCYECSHKHTETSMDLFAGVS